MSGDTRDTHLSVVIPAYNEEGRLEGTLERVLDYLRAQPYASEVLVVDDGSSDGTAGLAAEVLEGSTEHRVLVNEENRGKGYSVRRGMLEARGERRLFSDADLSTPIEHAADLLAAIEQGADIAIASRAIPGADIEVHQSLIRESAGRMFSVVQRALLGSGIKDTQCGFKMFTGEAAEAVFPHQTLERWAFDAELIFVAQRLGLEVAEVPVRWIDSPHTKVKMVTDGLKMVLDLVRIRARHGGLRRDRLQSPR
jgi:dolichyl-phosphate beta-glucosyltransferase